MSKGNTNRVLGHNAERHYRLIFKELGFNFCETARMASRLYDNAKIDLVNLPFNVQIKAGKQNGLNAGKELFNMENAIKVSFPPEDSVHKKERILIHRKYVGPGKKRLDEHDIVYISHSQLLKFEEMINEQIPLLSNKVSKIQIQSEYKHMVSMTFEVFKEKIIKAIYL